MHYTLNPNVSASCLYLPKLGEGRRLFSVKKPLTLKKGIFIYMSVKVISVPGKLHREGRLMVKLDHQINIKVGGRGRVEDWGTKALHGQFER